MKKIVIDVCGADAGLLPVVDGTAKALKQGVTFFPVLVGPAAELEAMLTARGISKEQYELVDATDAVTNDDPPTCVFAGKEESSLVKAYQRLKSDGDCCAMVSPGSTGALLVGSICRLGLLPGLKFPVLGSALPCSPDNMVCLVDCGANIECTASDLVRFAKMGEVFSRCHCGIENPRVRLMNVGREEGKGTALTKEAYEKLKALPLNFVGNLEGSDLVSGYADVVVTDGFSGNILLKSTEAAGKLAMQIVAEAAGDADPALVAKLQQAIFKKLEFNSQGAATFLGPKKIVVKMHGCANEDTVVSAIRHALQLEASGFIEAMTQAL
jgi:glycerol-3-phosphate acyltransferase PlsX